ncbi:hypothetical protein GPECTOR_8g261 [Gonium pectorale]|uniref:RING-type E3 ubiquitin transferase n=1 Tax=Gonium pectorale TaxID=33097 RepID=A0A150GSU4_GONPE|nr:hypothetical protein GPECTOR_8g261 [Gonium pectorale]|eukprot:KXZ52881.1 hypothetical protein GPECTOR_8g261 [Gonium pectorale]
MQLGWATLQSTSEFSSEEGVGDAPDSYAYDGKRIKKWHVKCTQYGEAWAAGDVIGCLLDLDKGEASFTRNGRSLGVAFTGVRTMQPHLAYFPAVSVSYAERCELNFGAQPLLYPAAGYEPIQAPPSAAATSAATYLVTCLERLVTAVQPQPYGHSPGPAECVRDAEGAAAGGGAIKSSASAAAAAAAAAASVGKGGAEGLSPRFSIPWESWLLMGSVALEHLAPHLLDAHIIGAVLMPAMLRLTGNSSGTSSGTSAPLAAGPASGFPSPPIASLLQLFELCLEPELLAAVVNVLLEALSRRCVTAALVPEQFPYSGSCQYLALAVALASRPALRAAWLRAPGLWGVLEGFLTRKGPSPDDLRALLPHVWWRGCSELSGDRERMRAALQALSTAITRVEDKQYELLCCLLGSPGAGAATGSGPGGPSPSDDALLQFLRYLVHKNRGATRDVPPPGLSDSTVLISTYFVLVRMLRVALPLVDSFPAASLFVKTAIKADLEPVNSLVRLGGIVTHLCRESPVTSQAELAPLPVAPPPRAPAPPAHGPPSPSASSAWGTEPGPSTASPSRGLPIRSPSSGASGCPLSPPLACDADAWVVARVRACPRLAAEMLDLAMSLYAFKVASSVKITHTLHNSLAAGLSGMEEAERHLRKATASGGAAAGASSGAAASYVAYLQEAREHFKQDVAGNIRFAYLLKVVFFSGWKQEACLSLAGWVSRMLCSAAALPGPLLSYVPACYLDCVLDTVTSLRYASEAASVGPLPPAAQAPTVAAWRTHGSLGDVLTLLVTLLHEPRICTPDAKEALVNSLGSLLEQPGMLPELERCAAARELLPAAALGAFDSRLWHPVAQLLLRLVRGEGFGEELPGAASGQAGARASGREGATAAVSGEAAGGAAAGSVLFRGLLLDTLRGEGPALKTFLHRLFNMANWATSEFATTVSGLHDLRRRHIQEQQQQFRKAAIMFELVTGLLRLLEFAACRLPEAFLGSGAQTSLNLNRLLEVVSFVLSHLTDGGDGRRLTQLLTVPPLDSPAGGTAVGPPSVSSTMRVERSLLSEKVNRAQALAPVVGALLGLWRSSAEGTAAGGAGDGGAEASSSGRGSGGGDGAAAGPGSWRAALLEALLRHSDTHTDQQMAYLRAVDWRTALPGADPGGLDAGVRDFIELLSAAAAARRQQQAAAAAGAGEAEAPEELLDPITSALMNDPVVLPDSQVTVDRSTIERHFMHSQTDPFSRTPLTLDALRPNEGVKRKIAEWVKSRSKA